MPLGFHSPHTYNSDGDEPPGLKYRREQLAAAERERTQFTKEAESPITGNVSTRRDVEVKRRALERQERYARGQYPVKGAS